MSFLLLGADGQVGFELMRALAPLGPMVPTTRKGILPGGAPCAVCDLANPGALRDLIESTRPRWIINAAAYTAVDRAEDESALAMVVNGEALAAIGAAAQPIGARVLHFSTDYVFSGASDRPWREQDETAPLGSYGRSKRAGEIALQESGAPYLILRTAWVYGARGANFLRTMLRLGRERDRLSVVADQVGTPTPARLIAACSALLVYALSDARRDDPRFGTYHLTATGSASWHEFACRIFDTAFASGLVQRRPEVVPISSAEYPTRATRPRYSVLDTRKLESAFGLVLPHWSEALAGVMGELNP